MLETKFKTNNDLIQYADKIGWLYPLRELINVAHGVETRKHWLSKIPFFKPSKQSKGKVAWDLSPEQSNRFFTWIKDVEVDGKKLFPNIKWESLNE